MRACQPEHHDAPVVRARLIGWQQGATDYWGAGRYLKREQIGKDSYRFEGPRVIYTIALSWQRLVRIHKYRVTCSVVSSVEHLNLCRIIVRSVFSSHIEHKDQNELLLKKEKLKLT